MARNKKTEEPVVHRGADTANVEGLSGAVIDRSITATLDENYMPYAMSVIVSRASPRLTASSLPTASSCIPCTPWAC